MRNTAAVTILLLLLSSGCTYEYRKDYEESNTGTGFDVACVSDVVDNYPNASEVDYLTNAVSFENNSYSTLVIYDERATVSSMLRVVGSVGWLRKDLDRETSAIADKLSAHCRVPATRSDGTRRAVDRSSSSTGFSLQPGKPSWKIK